MSSTPAPRTPSRPSSRASDFGGSLAGSTYLYKPGNPRDPLDAEVAAIVNSIAHGLLIERVDPPLKTIPREGEEIRAQYALEESTIRGKVQDQDADDQVQQPWRAAADLALK